MKKLMVMMAAGVSALALSADTWFADAVSNIDSWPSDGAEKALTDIGTWSGTAGATLGTGKLELDADAEDPLTFTAASTKDLAEGTEAVQINTTMSFAPFASASAITVPNDAKAGIVLVGDADNGYDFYVLGSDGAEESPANEFQIVSATHTATIPEDVAVVVSATVDNGDLQVTYTIGENDPVVKTVVAANKQFSTAAFTGSGELSALTGTYTPAAAPTYTFTLAAVTGIDSFVVSNADNTAEIAYDNGYTVEQGATVNIYAIPAEGKFVSPASAERTISASGEIDLTSVFTVIQAPVKIGTEFYLTFASALSNATDGATITFVDDFSGVWFDSTDAGLNTLTDKFKTTGLTIDLNGKVWTISGGNRLIENRKGNKFKFMNGTIDVAIGATQKNFLYNYAEMCEFCDVTLDLRNLAQVEAAGFADNPSFDSRNNTALVCQNGSLKLSGNTTVILPSARTENLVSMLDRAGAAYEPGMLILDVNGELSGDVFLLGEFGISVGAQTVFTNGTVYTGAANNSGFLVAGAEGSPYKAMIGEFIPGTGSSSTQIVAGKLYSDLAAANDEVAASGFAKVITAVQNDTLESLSLNGSAGQLAVPTNITLTVTSSFALNGAKVNLAEGGTLVVPTQLTIASDFVAPAEGKAVVEAGTGPYTYTIAPAAEDWPENPETVAGQKAGEVFAGIPSNLANVDACALATWAKTKEVAFSDKAGIKVNAFLLDCANTDVAIADEQADFKVSIAIVEGVPVITPANGDTYKNGKIELEGRASLTEGDWAAYDSATHKFIRAKLVPAEVPAE